VEGWIKSGGLKKKWRVEEKVEGMEGWRVDFG
jgi:hypothetical protein